MGAAALRVVEGQVRAYRHMWKGTVSTALLAPVLYLGAIGLGLGTLVDQAQPGRLPGGSYLAFLAPGLFVASAMQLAAADSMWPVTAGVKWQKTYTATLATPVSVPALVAGHLGWVVIRVTLLATAFVIAMLLFDAATLPDAVAVMPVALLVALSFAAPVMAFSAAVSREDALVSLIRFGILPLYLFSGTFFPLAAVPEALRPIAYVTPLWHGVELARAATTAAEPAWPVAVHLSVPALFLAVGFVLSVRAVRRKALP